MGLAAVALALVALAAPQTPLEKARADLQLRREAVIRAYDLAAQRSRLDAYARTCDRAFLDPAIARQAPIGRLPFVAADRREFLQRAAAFAAERFGLRLSGLSVKFSRLPQNTAGLVKVADDRVTVEVSERHRDDDEQILAIVAHEFAHIVLEAPGSGVSKRDANDEELADAAVVMAGMGPLFLRVAYREGVSVTGGKAEWSVRRTGYLNPVAIAYLTLLQAEMAGLPQMTYRGLVGDWYEPVWSVRARRQDEHGPVA